MRGGEILRGGRFGRLDREPIRARANFVLSDARHAARGRTAEELIAKVKPAGVYASVVEVPQNAQKYPSVKVVHVFSKSDRKTLEAHGRSGAR